MELLIPGMLSIIIYLLCKENKRMKDKYEGGY